MTPLLLSAALAGEPVPLDGGWDRARLVDAAGVPRLVLFDAEAARLVDPETGTRTLDLPGVVDLVDADVDGDGDVDMVQCGPDGLVARFGARSRLLSEQPCRAVARVEADRTLLVAVLDQPHRWGLGAGGPVDLGPFGSPVPPGPVRLIPGGDSVALLHAGGLELWGPFGQRVVVTGTAPDGATRLDDGWTWSTNGRVHGAAGRWFDDARSLVAVDLDADGAVELAAIHPESQLVGRLVDGVERALPLPFAPRALLAGDLDGDGGDDLLLVGDHALLAMHAAGPSPAPQLAEPLRAPAPTRPLAGVPMPLFQATDGTLASGRTPPRSMMVGGIGVMLGSTVGGAVGLAGSPAGFATVGRSGRGTHRWIGIDSAPLFIQVGGDGVATIHAVNLSGGVSFGNPHLTGGPYLTAGSGGQGAGLRVGFHPIETRSGVLHGLEWRAAATTPLGTFGPDPVVGHVLIAWSTAVPMGGQAGFDRSLPGVVERPAAARPDGVGTCRRFGFTLGATAGGSSGEYGWDTVGRALRFDIAATPSASAFCESGRDVHDLFLSVDSAPWFRYRIPVRQRTGDVQLRHMGSITAGYHVGTDLLRVGPVATAGVWATGAGARVALTPVSLRRAGHHGLDARILFLWPSASAVEGWLGYTTWFDPRR